MVAPLGSPFAGTAPTGYVGGPSSQSGSMNAGNGGGLTGNNSNPGLLGTGQYVAPAYNINSNAFVNPTGNQGQNWNNAMAGFLGNTTGAAPQLGQAAQAAGPNMGQYNQTYNQQQALASQYGQMAAGQGPSLAAVTAQQQANQNMAQQLASIRAGGGNPALARYQAGNALGSTQQQASQQAVLGRTQEEMGAMQAQAGLYGNLNQQALNAQQLQQQNQQFNVGAQNQFGLSQAQLQANQNALNAQQYNQYTANLGAVNAQQLNANISQQQLGVQQQLGLDQIQQQAYAQSAKNNAGVLGGLGSMAQGVGGLMAMAAL